ncbi:MAG: hypothetical protein AAFW95_03160 [Cyanobacteria bacterium J06638_6]
MTDRGWAGRSYRRAWLLAMVLIMVMALLGVARSQQSLAPEVVAIDQTLVAEVGKAAWRSRLAPHQHLVVVDGDLAPVRRCRVCRKACPACPWATSQP